MSNIYKDKANIINEITANNVKPVEAVACCIDVKIYCPKKRKAKYPPIRPIVIEITK